jgi:hypothetical protein
MHSFTVVTREVEFAGRQITCDVVRSDGRVVRSGLWPHFAEMHCELLNRFASEGWTNDRYWRELAARMDAARRAA